MRMIFVRHGEPDYALDCLTEEGKKQAEAASVRLEREGIGEIFSSPQGRARETADYTARRLGLDVSILDFMHEISWGGDEIPERGHPWKLADMMVRDDFDFRAEDWKQHPYFRGNPATACFEMIAVRIDEFLRGKGYRHEGSRFFCENGTDTTIALFSHGGSGACALSHILALPFPYVSCMMPYGFTSVTILSFPTEPGAYVHPRIELFNDCAHIRTDPEGPRIQQVC